MRKLALSVAVALSSFLSKPALALEFEEVYLICSDERLVGHNVFEAPKFYISIKNNVAHIRTMFFEVESYLFKGKHSMLKKVEVPAMRSALGIKEFEISFLETRFTPTFIIDRTSLEVTQKYPRKKLGDCKLEEENSFQKALNLGRETAMKNLDLFIQQRNAEAKKKYREHQEKLSQRKF